jgi:hypothetical protein
MPLIGSLMRDQTRLSSSRRPQPGAMMGPESTMPMMGGPGRIGMMGMMGMADHVEGRIAFLRAELKITEAQMPQWNLSPMRCTRMLPQ